MRYLLLCVVVLPSCELLSAAAADPVVAEGLAKVVEKAGSGELWGAGYALGSVAIALAGKWLHGRVKKSGPGEIIGGAA